MYKKYYYILFYLCANFLFAQDPPPGFNYNQGFSQGFYFFEDITIAGDQLDPEDWRWPRSGLSHRDRM